jgi:hypothetical protein
MTHQINLSDEEYEILAAQAARSGLDPEQLLHKTIYKMQPIAQRKRPLTLDELEERQYLEGKISHIPTRRPLTPEELEEREELAQLFAGGKPASEMVIEDRGPY